MPPDFKYLVSLQTSDGRRAVVIDWTPEEARKRAAFFDRNGGWEDADIEIITYVRGSRIERVLAQEKLCP